MDDQTESQAGSGAPAATTGGAEAGAAIEAAPAAAPGPVPDAAPAARVRIWRQRVRRIRRGIFHEDYNRQTGRARAAREMGAGLVRLIEAFCLVVAWPFQRLFGRRADRDDGGQRPRDPEQRDGAAVRRPD